MLDDGGGVHMKADRHFSTAPICIEAFLDDRASGSGCPPCGELGILFQIVTAWECVKAPVDLKMRRWSCVRKLFAHDLLVSNME